MASIQHMNKTILITGAAGFIGSQMADWIVGNHPEYEVVGIDTLQGGFTENVHPKITFYKMDAGDAELAKIFAKHRPVYVYHFAAYAAEGLSPFIRTFNYRNNVVATANVVNQCIAYDVKRLISTSSMAVYGKGKPPFDEEAAPAPIDPYGIAKYACELDIEVAGEQHGLDWCVIRPHNVYGPKQNIWDKYRNVLGIWMYQQMKGEAMTIFGDGEQKRAFSYIGDCLPPLWRAATDPRASKQIINLGSGVFYSINEANAVMRKVIGAGKDVHVEARHEVKNAYPTWQKSERILDYHDKTNLADGLAVMWQWAQKQPERPQFVWPEYELEKGLYSFWKKNG